MILELAYYDDPILRQRADPIEAITDEIKQLAANMIETMLHYNGVGLAATQVKQMVRMFVVNLNGETEDGEMILGKPRVYINPEVTETSVEESERSEGCLSIPKLYVPVMRPLTIKLCAQGLDGVQFEEELYGYVARNRLHELDHLNGTLFIDHIKGKQRTELEPVLRRIKMQYSK